MSSLNYLEKLLDGVEVEWIPLAEVVDFKRGEQLKPTSIIPGPYPIVTASKTEVGSHSKWNFGPMSITITSHGAYAGHVNYWSTPIWLANNVFLLSPKNNLLHKFLYYFLKNIESIIQGLAKGGGVPYFNTRDIAPLLIPIPCPDTPKKSLEIQTEIVRILDSFTELSAELTAELTARKKQYNHYRDQLFSFEDGDVEWKTLGSLAENLDSMRKPITSGLRDPGEIPYYGASGIVDYVKDFIFDGDYLLVSEDGANLLARNTPIAFSVSGKSWVNNHAHVLKFETYAERKYVEYYLNSIDLTPYISGAAQPKLTKGNLESISIPNPSPDEKVRIVSILDKFDALSNSVTDGLPLEIELRQKQYEYYRNLLLSFPKPEEVDA